MNLLGISTHHAGRTCSVTYLSFTCHVGPCQNGTALLRVADGGDGFLCRVAANMPNKK